MMLLCSTSRFRDLFPPAHLPYPQVLVCSDAMTRGMDVEAVQARWLVCGADFLPHLSGQRLLLHGCCACLPTAVNIPVISMCSCAHPCLYQPLNTTVWHSLHAERGEL